MNLRDDASIWWVGFNSKQIQALSDKEYEQVVLDKWSHNVKRNKKITRYLYSCDNIL
jgi:hypothetical protein